MKQWIWRSALALLIILIVGFGIIINKEKKEPTTVNNNEDHAVVATDSGNTATANPTGTNEPTTTGEKNDQTRNQEPQVLTPSIEGSDIDAVAYETVSAEKTKNSIEAHVIVDDSIENVARFVLPYSNFIKDLNSNIDSVTVIIYKSQLEADAKHASWKFEDGKLHIL